MRRAPSYRLRVPDPLVALIRGLHPELKRRVMVSLKMIASDPYLGKPLKDEMEGLRSFRVKGFRIIYRIGGDKKIQIVAIGPRDRIDEDTYQ